MTTSIVILGAGQAGFQAAASLRQCGFDGTITLVGDEAGLPYQRPPLSKAYLLGKADAAGLHFRPEGFFTDNRVDLIEDHAVSIDRASRTVTLKHGGRTRYDHLILATGARNRPLSVSGANLNGVYGLRTLADADALRAKLTSVEDVVVIGAGFIGLEFAAVAASLGKNVHVVELADRVMKRAVSPDISAVFTQAHEQWGVHFHLQTGIARLTGKGDVSGVDLADGTRLPVGLVVYGIGVLPNAEIAAEAGLKCANGVEVNDRLTTEDPNISAIGDCALFPCCQAAGQMIRLESVQNAADQARALAAGLTGGQGSYTAFPWFWSDQGDLKLQMAGLAEGHDTAIRLGDPATRSFSTLLFRQGRMIASESVNRPGDFMTARKLLGTPGRILPTLAEATSDGFDLRVWDKNTAKQPPERTVA